MHRRWAKRRIAQPPWRSECQRTNDDTVRVNAVAEQVAEATEQRTALALLHDGDLAVCAHGATVGAKGDRRMRALLKRCERG